MLLKLLVPHYNRMIPSGRIVRWHKAEGDWVDYGENLFDLEVDKVRITDPIRAGSAGDWLKKMSQRLEEKAAGAVPGEMDGPTMVGVAYMRVCASDGGILRKILAREGDIRKVGEVVAVLATKEGETGEEAEQALDEACVFRAVANMIRLDEGE